MVGNEVSQAHCDFQHFWENHVQTHFNCFQATIAKLQFGTLFRPARAVAKPRLYIIIRHAYTSSYLFILQNLSKANV